MARFPTHLFTVKRKWRTQTNSLAYDIVDSLPGSLADASNNLPSAAYPLRTRYWRVCRQIDGIWQGYLFRERNRKHGTLKGTKLPQAVTEKLAAFAMLAAHDMEET